MNTAKKKENLIKENIVKSLEYQNFKKLKAKFDRTSEILRKTPENAGKLIQAENMFKR